MTEPTDAAIDTLILDHGVMAKAWPTQRQLHAFARAVLAKWGTPATGGVPAGTVLYTVYGTQYVSWRTKPPAHGTLLYTTPQPTQPQAGAVPLTCEWAHNENDGFWESACGEAWRFDDGGPAENSMHFCHSCGKSLRIKGEEAGNADA